ncbi:MAG: DNA translocase FtsK [Chloroflexi bacterium]|nr:DNA translocase FtsK [Chloroflexota bacterium]
MARSRRARSGFASPLGLFRAELVGALLVALALIVVPFLLPLASVLADARDGIVGTLGVHVFTTTLLIALLGTLIALRYTFWLQDQARHICGALLLLVFSAGALGLWQPAQALGGVDLGEHSAGGDLGRALTDGAWATAAWLLTLPAGFALLWPATALRMLEALPGVLAAVAIVVWQGSAALARVGWRSLRLLFAGVLGASHARATAPVENGTPGDALANLDAYDEDELYEDEEYDELDELDDEALEPGPPARPHRKPAQMPMDLEHPVQEWRHSPDGWQLPPTSTLVANVDPPDTTAENDRRAELIVETLASFGVDARVTQINEGPTVTQFGVEPGWDVRTRTLLERDTSGQPLLDPDGQPRLREREVSRTRIRVNRITALGNDLALALATPALRIEAPVPGKSVVGIEVPNASARVVTLRSVMESAAFRKATAQQPLSIALGAGVSGDPVVADLATMPHLLIAGATGSGKSVCLNAIITCLLMNHSPEELRLILIDPKRVELTTFDRVPHLAFSKIVVDMDKVVGTLQAVIHEMESRYRRFAEAGVRNIARYNEQAEQLRLPYWVVVIDELADLMMAAPGQVEQQLVRLAQLARATGIHLVVATQRPSVDVVTGLIKANFPTRIAFAMSSQVDSRTVLDQGGAEKLLGRGDMLYVPTDAQKPVRLQGVYVSDAEIERVVAFWSDGRFGALVPEKHDDLLHAAERDLLAQEAAAEDADPMLTRALELAREHERMSTSMLQRRLRIGYPRAARVMDELETRGIVGPPDGPSSSRPVLLHDENAPEEADDELLLDKDDADAELDEPADQLGDGDEEELDEPDGESVAGGAGPRRRRLVPGPEAGGPRERHAMTRSRRGTRRPR